MVYLNHAGTSWPKPEPVQSAVRATLAAPPEPWPEIFAQQHGRVAKAFGISDPQRLLLTPGCTSALALAVSELAWSPGDRILISGMEHHALTRPVLALRELGVKVDVLPRGDKAPLDLDRLNSELQRGQVKLVALSAASNVTGELLPFEAAGEMAREHGALCLLDGAQIAGWLPVDVERLKLDLFAFAGHKGLQAPWGIGGLFVAEHVPMTASGAQCNLPLPGEDNACNSMPGYCDVGSVDRLALAGLAGSLDWLESTAQASRLAVAREQIECMAQGLESKAGIQLLGSRHSSARLPTVAFTASSLSPTEIEAAFRSRGVIVASGFQCAPMAHEALKTQQTGVVRMSAGPGTTAEELDRALAAIDEIDF